MTKLRATAVLASVLLLPAAATAGVVLGASGARISGHLSSTSFTAAQAASVKVTYRFSASSRRYGYLLTVKKGSRWQTVKRVSRTGRFTGSHTVTVKGLFAGKAIGVGSYRLRLSADAGSTLLRFKVVKATGGVVPRAGSWATTSLSGPVTGSGGGSTMTITGMSFVVGSGQATVGAFGFPYTWSGTPGPPTYNCSGSGDSVMTSGNTSPITGGRFSSPNPTGAWSGPVSGFADGTFDSATTAHGTARANGFVGGGTGCFSIAGMSVQTGTFSWTATWRSGG